MQKECDLVECDNVLSCPVTISDFDLRRLFKKSLLVNSGVPIAFFFINVFSRFPFNFLDLSGWLGIRDLSAFFITLELYLSTTLLYSPLRVFLVLCSNDILKFSSNKILPCFVIWCHNAQWWWNTFSRFWNTVPYKNKADRNVP